MMKFLPVLIAILLSLANFQIFDSNKNQLSSEPIENKNPRNHLTQDSANRQEVTAKVLSVSEASSKNIDEPEEEPFALDSDDNIRIIRLTWDVVPRAVKYKVSFEGQDAVSYTTGIEIQVRSNKPEFKITALDFNNKTVKHNVKITETEDNPFSPRTTTEFDKMSSPPVYLVYSWIPAWQADHYEIQLFKDGELYRNYLTDFHPKDDNFDFYDKIPVLEEGEYYWRVRGMDEFDEALTNWSEKNPGNSFTVTTPERFCALGDSITHGGGSISVPPSTVVYNWESYCDFPIKNLGKSGDTTYKLLDRFDEDVLPFSPEVLFIMAGVNDFRSNILGWDSVMNLSELRDKCKSYGITPVFITPTPLNPDLIRKVKFIENPPYDWKEQRAYICDWMKKQEHCIDISEALSDGNGYLKAELAVDGLHPDAEGKKIIGQAVENWLNNYLTGGNSNG